MSRNKSNHRKRVEKWLKEDQILIKSFKLKNLNTYKKSRYANTLDVRERPLFYRFNFANVSGNFWQVQESIRRDREVL